MKLETTGRRADALKSVTEALLAYEPSDSYTLRRPWSGRAAHAVLLAALAKIEFGRGYYDDAERDAQKAANLGVKTAYAIRARALSKQARLLDAAEAYDLAVLAEPSSSNLFVERGELKLKLVKLQDAVADETKALELGASGDMRLRALLVRARTRLAMGDMAAGMTDLASVLESDPGNSLARLLRGQARFAARDFDGAIEDSSELAKLDPTNGPAYLLRAESNLAKGKKAEAKKDLRQAQKLMPGHPRVTQLFEELRKPT